MTATTYATMGKIELRAACKEVGIRNYGKMDNAGMRAALEAVAAAQDKAMKALDAKVAAQADHPEVVVSGHNPFDALMGKKVDLKAQNGHRVVDGRRQRASDAKAPQPEQTVGRSKGYRIQAEREERNGVKRPSEGTVCGAVWEQFDRRYNSKGGLNSSHLAEIAEEHNWNRNNVNCEYYAWRKFMGIKGRQAA